MPAIDRQGTYKGVIKDFGVTTTSKKGLPQFVVTLLATELYDEADETWGDWKDYEQSIIGYFVLVTLDKHGQVVKCLNYDQVMKATGWDGETFASLGAMTLKDKVVQFRIIEDTYEGQTRFKVSWIDAEDAEFGLRKLSGKDLTALDAKFKVASSKPKTAATPKKKKAAPKPPKAKKPVETEKPETDIDEPDPALEPCDENTAYKICVAANLKLVKPVPDEVLDDYWVANVEKIAKDTDAVTDVEWAAIKVATLNDLSIPF